MIVGWRIEFDFRLTVNINDAKEYFSNQLNNVMTDTLFDSVFCRLPKSDDKLPLRTKNTLNDNRQVLEVADTETMEKFLSSCSKETKTNVQISLPYVLLYIPDQIFLERLYNRFEHFFVVRKVFRCNVFVFNLVL